MSRPALPGGARLHDCGARVGLLSRGPDTRAGGRARRLVRWLAVRYIRRCGRDVGGSAIGGSGATTPPAMLGTAVVHTAVDDCSRVAYAEICVGETTAAAGPSCAVLRRAVAWCC